MARYVIDRSVVLQLLSEELTPSPDHMLLAPTLVRSEVLDSLYRAAHDGTLPRQVARDRLAQFAEMKVRYLGDRVLRRRAWDVAEELDWGSTCAAEYIALTLLQADAFVTLDGDLAAEVEQMITTVPITAIL